MRDWINDVPETDREKVRGLYEKAKTFEATIDVLKTWHPKGHLNTDPIKNLEEYFKYIRVCTHDFTWFRGEPKDYGSLIPKLYRNMEGDNILEQQIKERHYFFEFQRRARPLAAEISVDDQWSWYFLIQHYGGPTRLLDWTQDAAVALFFALDTDRENTDDAIVICLTPTVLLEYVFNELGHEAIVSDKVLYPGEEPTNKWIANISESNDPTIWDLPSSPIALLPPHLNPRISAQRSCFTLFGKKTDGFYKEGKQIVCPTCGQQIFGRLVIDGKSKNDLRKELARIGITSGKIYPGLDGLCKEITGEIFA